MLRLNIMIIGQFIVNDDFIIKPIDGFGSRDLLRVALATEKPEVLFIFTDPRFFIWLFEMEDEVHQICPIAWWHVWDNYPFPAYNSALYESTDLINCHSHMTYEMIKEHYPDKTNFIPHAIPEEIFFPITPEANVAYREKILGEKNKDAFVGIWVNRNAKRKRSSDVLVAWKKFLEDLEEKTGERNAHLIMHTDPLDQEGANLYLVSEQLKIEKNVYFSTDRLDFDKMNILYNISDFCLNMSYAEGFGLSTLESMQTGTPIVAVKTGGLTRQVVDHRDGTENGVALDVDLKTLVGSQQVPYIYEDYATCENIANGIMKMYEMSKEEKAALGEKSRKYALSEFNLSDTVDMWHTTMKTLAENWKKEYKSWECKTF